MDVTVYIMDTAEISALPIQQIERLIPLRFKKAAGLGQKSDTLLSLCAGLLLRQTVGIKDETLIKYSENGKPCAQGYPFFNLSHSGNLAAIAIDDSPLGIDIQQMRQRHSDTARAFTEQEKKWLANRQEQDFFRLWTYKESLAKASDMPLAKVLKKISILPLLEKEPVELSGSTYYGAQLIYGEYAVSCCAMHSIDGIIIKKIKPQL